ncbi:Phosphatidylserine lipase ABHD16A [Pseudolycoriella hygida]|uniref:Phosphatidylserine lipase ABHD16A n=1 Tax=Pseudolycoriella hygida TaxID=35572 RepID=A0A9Q0N0F6_9DIPT|nr:Phosphatidylserine lipase ABHD16A [Pseudolycoriella hygida]
MTFLNYIFSPRLFKVYGDASQKFYEPGGLEKWGDQIIYSLSMMWNISFYTSPLILTFLIRRGCFVAESITSFAKISAGISLIVVISLCMRGIGRSQSKVYTKFAKSLEAAKANSKNEEIKNELRLFDFEFKDWPVDFSVKEHNDAKKPRQVIAARSRPYWISSLPCEIAAYIAIHTFGLRMIYPGSVKLIQNYLHPMLVEGRAKLIENGHAKRYKLLTRDDNEVDSIFVDKRGISANGKTLVICSEGNAGFYEIGIMFTPMNLNYSVLGWNHPGFGGSTGKPFPDQDQNAMDAVVQFAINKLGFQPENILLFGWSIGGYSTLWAATQYPDNKGVIVDATFDDVLHLALPRMPQSLTGIVRIAIRQYVNLHNSELLSKYNGPIFMIRRTEDEVISENMDVSTNRGNNLLINMLKQRFPNIFKTEQVNLVNKMLSRPIEKTTDNSTDQLCLSLLLSYVSENGKSYPVEIGENYTEAQRNQMAEYLVYKHFMDYKSSHCTPLPVEYFQTPWTLPDEDTDFVFT